MLSSISIFKEKSERKLFFIITFLFLINIISVYFSEIGILIALLEITILIIYFMKGNFERYILYLLMFIVTSFEVQEFVTIDKSGDFYNFLNLPYIYRYHVYILFLIPTILIIRNGDISLFWRNLKKNKNIRRYNLGLMFLIVLGVGSGLLNLLINDNNIQNSSIYWMFARRDLISYFSIFLFGFYISYLLLMYSQFQKTLEKFLKCILLSLLPCAIITTVIGLYGNYSGHNALLLPLVAFFGIGLMWFPLFSDYKNKKILFVFGFLLFLIMFKYPTPLSGKWWVFVMGIPFFILYKYTSKITYKKIAYINLLLPVVLVAILFLSMLLPDNIKVENELAYDKFRQAVDVMAIFDNDWFVNLPDSPKFRVDEFINIIYEYKETPQGFLFGKGFGGSITHHTNYLDWNQTDAFSTDQIREGRYFSLHFAPNIFFLKFGFIGLYFFIMIILIGIVNLRSNPWILSGTLWFFLYFNYYISLYFGLCCLLLGLYKVSQDRNKK